MRPMFQLAYGFVMIALLMAIQAAALYVLWWLVMMVVRFVPIVGRKHKHRDWDRLNS
jgi:hypothetical protein